MKILLAFLIFSGLLNFNILEKENDEGTTIPGNNVFLNPTSGSDIYGNGSLQSPFKTLNRVSQYMFSNFVDTIYFLGTNHSKVNQQLMRPNTSTNWVFIRPYNDSAVTLSGLDTTFKSWEAVININSSRYLDIKGLNIKGDNDSSAGIRVVSDNANYESRYIKISNCKINNVKRQGILIQARNVTVENCEIDSAVLINKNSTLSGGWPSALSVYFYYGNYGYNDSIIIRNNYIHNVWGEGIGLVRAKNFIVSGNHVKDCFSVGIYCDNSRYGKIFNNWIHSTSDYYNRYYDQNLTAPACGIYWAAEGSQIYCIDSIVRNIDIYNNLIVRTCSAFGWFDDTSNHHNSDSYKNINIYYNTVYKTIGYETFNIDYTQINPNRIPPDSCNFRNNIICKPTYNGNMQSYFSQSSDYGTAWNITNNCFMHGVINYPNNKFGPASFVDSNNFQSPENLKIKESSICKGQGIWIPGITYDYWNMLRNSPSCIGFHEFGGISGIKGNDVIQDYEISQNYPNPFNAVTVLNFVNKKAGYLKIEIFNILGQNVNTQPYKFYAAGNHKIQLDFSNLPSGIYFCKAAINNFSELNRMILVK